MHARSVHTVTRARAPRAPSLTRSPVGAAQSPAGFLVGVAKGTTSLVTNVSYGIFNIGTGITGSMGNSLSHATFDDAYIKAHMRAHQERPDNMVHGLVARPLVSTEPSVALFAARSPLHATRRTQSDVSVAAIGGVSRVPPAGEHPRRCVRLRVRLSPCSLALGVKGLSVGIANGIAGVVTQPINGAMANGAEGFVKGIGKGLIGLPVKSLVGVSDLTHKIFEGFRNTGQSSDDREHQRRQRMVYGPTKSLRVYSPEDATVAMMLNLVRRRDHNRKDTELISRDRTRSEQHERAEAEGPVLECSRLLVVRYALRLDLDALR